MLIYEVGIIDTFQTCCKYFIWDEQELCSNYPFDVTTYFTIPYMTNLSFKHIDIHLIEIIIDSMKMGKSIDLLFCIIYDTQPCYVLIVLQMINMFMKQEIDWFIHTKYLFNELKYTNCS